MSEIVFDILYWDVWKDKRIGGKFMTFLCGEIDTFICPAYNGN